jgi:hypothetical protein
VITFYRMIANPIGYIPPRAIISSDGNGIVYELKHPSRIGELMTKYFALARNGNELRLRPGMFLGGGEFGREWRSILSAYFKMDYIKFW